MRTDTLSLDQAPPLVIPMSFFLTAPLAVAVAGVLLLLQGSAVLISGWAPATLAFTHLGTLGFLAMVMVGALSQMSPVVAAARVPWVRVAHVVHLLLLAAVALLAWAGLRAEPGAFTMGFRLAGLAISLFLLPMGWALLRTTARTDTVQGMRLALLALLAVAGLGLAMSETLAGHELIADRALAIRVHLGLALLCWVGGLIAAVSWQVVPMFYLCEEPARRDRRLILCGLLASLVLLPGVLAAASLSASRDLAMLASLPAALAIWAWHPWTTFRAMRTRKRKRADASLEFWKAGLACAPLCLALGLLAHFSHDPRITLLFGWLAIWGWAGLVVHGMLHRIVPFLAWFHELSPLVGKAAVPSTRGLLPDSRTRLGLRLHLASLLAGAVAILTRLDALAWLTGLCLIAVAASMLHALGATLHRARRASRQAALELAK